MQSLDGAVLRLTIERSVVKRGRISAIEQLRDVQLRFREPETALFSIDLRHVASHEGIRRCEDHGNFGLFTAGGELTSAHQRKSETDARQRVLLVHPDRALERGDSALRRRSPEMYEAEHGLHVWHVRVERDGVLGGCKGTLRIAVAQAQLREPCPRERVARLEVRGEREACERRTELEHSLLNVR